jgi:hypothetical protein
MVRFHWALCAIDLCAVVMSIHCHYDTAISDLERGGWRMPSIDTFRRLKSDSFNRHNWYHRRHTSVTDLKQRPGTAHDYSSAKRRQIIPNLSSTVLPREAGLRSFARGSPHCIDGHSLYECPPKRMSSKAFANLMINGHSSESILTETTTYTFSPWRKN